MPALVQGGKPPQRAWPAIRLGQHRGGEQHMEQGGTRVQIPMALPDAHGQWGRPSLQAHPGDRAQSSSDGQEARKKRHTSCHLSGAWRSSWALPLAKPHCLPTVGHTNGTSGSDRCGKDTMPEPQP